MSACWCFEPLSWQDDWSVLADPARLAPFEVGNHRTNTYLLQRAELHADVRPNAHWQMFVQLQDDRAPGKDIITPVNPLFPNAYYFTLMSTPTYVNLIHVRPSLELHPSQSLMLIARVGLQWRQTMDDAVYVIPNRPVPGTAGQPGHWTGVYGQLRAEWQINRRAGGLDASYANVELRFAW